MEQGDAEFVHGNIRHLRVHMNDGTYVGFTYRDIPKGGHYKDIGEVHGPEEDLK